MASGQPDGNTAKVGDLATPIAGLAGDGTWQAVAVDTDGGIALAVGATGIGKAEDEPHVSGDVGVMMLGVRAGGGSGSYAGTIGDYSPIALDANGGVANAYYDGSGWNAARANEPITVFASASRTASVNSSTLTSHNGRGALVMVDVTAVTGAASITVTIQSMQTIGNVYRDVLTSAAITTTGQAWLRVYPGITAVANAAVSDLLGRTWRVVVTHGTADAITYSVQAINAL